MITQPDGTADQRIKVSGFTITSASFHSNQRDSRAKLKRADERASVCGSRHFRSRANRATPLAPVSFEWTEILGSERLTGALLDRLTHHVHILEMNGDSYRLKQSRRKRTSSTQP